MDIMYVPDAEFVQAVKEMQCTATNIDGHMRWVCKREDTPSGFIIRPESAHNGENDKKAE